MGNDNNCVRKKDDLADALGKCEGLVIYGAGLVGNCMIQYLIKEKMASRVICVAVKSREGNPEAIMGIPVFTLGELEDYKEKYFFLIATLEHLQDSIKEELEKFGCRTILGISNTYYTQIREEINDFTPDVVCNLRKGIGYMLDRFRQMDQKIDQLRDRLDNFVYLVEEQNEISAVNTRAFARYRNCNYGKDVVIMATGPTLNHYKLVNGAIHIGVNTVYKNPGIPLDFLFVQDGRAEFLNGGKFEKLEDVACKIFMGRVSKSTHVEWSEFPESYRLGGNVTDYIMAQAHAQAGIYRDICHHPVYGGLTVVFSALHFALYTYPSKIYLVGCDISSEGYYDGTVDKSTLINTAKANELKEDYKLMKEFAGLHYPETEIISVNPVGLKGIFKEIYT